MVNLLDYQQWMITYTYEPSDKDIDIDFESDFRPCRISSSIRETAYLKKYAFM